MLFLSGADTRPKYFSRLSRKRKIARQLTLRAPKFPEKIRKPFETTIYKKMKHGYRK